MSNQSTGPLQSMQLKASQPTSIEPRPSRTRQGRRSIGQSAVRHHQPTHHPPQTSLCEPPICLSDGLVVKNNYVGISIAYGVERATFATVRRSTYSTMVNGIGYRIINATCKRASPPRRIGPPALTPHSCIIQLGKMICYRRSRAS